MMAAYLYFGAGCGLFAIRSFQRITKSPNPEARISRSDGPYIVGMVLLDIAAPICLMFGISLTTAANASLLSNFEIVTTSLIALLIFKETISPKLWTAIILVSSASFLLSLDGASGIIFSKGSLLIMLASLCWGFENNCTRKLSAKDPQEIVIIKGLCSGTGAWIIALSAGEVFHFTPYILFALLLGTVAYGLSIFFYVRAQRSLGAAKTSVCYAITPFIGTALSFAIFHGAPTLTFLIALLLMIAGTYFIISDTAKS
jgi:drug/metabolite transporter (DMT)-like permease